MSSQNLQRIIDDSIKQITPTADMLPGVVLLHNITDGSVVWISKRGEKELNITLEEITSLTAAEYYERYFNAEDARDYVPKILSLIDRNNDEEICTFFQQVRFSIKEDYNWHMASTKIFSRDDNGKPLLTITMAFPIDAMHHMALKATRLLEENNFLRKNAQAFASLSFREKEVLKLMALGKSSSYTADLLFIATHTIETHRKNIKQKLNTNSYYELCEYARAFDLI
jgi:DNA-binding CsgD family transcriptional regulator